MLEARLVLSSPTPTLKKRSNYGTSGGHGEPTVRIIRAGREGVAEEQRVGERLVLGDLDGLSAGVSLRAFPLH